jgi:hypothetical protein
MLFRNFFDRSELIHAGIIYDDVELPVVLDCRVDDVIRISEFCYVTANGYSLASGLGDRVDDLICTVLARRVIDHDRCPFGRERLCDRGTYPF